MRVAVQRDRGARVGRGARAERLECARVDLPLQVGVGLEAEQLVAVPVQLAC